MGEEIRRDKRMRPDQAGGMSLRGCSTWEEAHQVVCESEKLKRGTSAFSRFAGATQHTGAPIKPTKVTPSHLDGNLNHDTGAFGKGKHKGKGGVGGGKVKDRPQKSDKPCFEML